jgi:hypothetical protein
MSIARVYGRIILSHVENEILDIDLYDGRWNYKRYVLGDDYSSSNIDQEFVFCLSSKVLKRALV